MRVVSNSGALRYDYGVAGCSRCGSGSDVGEGRKQAASWRYCGVCQGELGSEARDRWIHRAAASKDWLCRGGLSVRRRGKRQASSVRCRVSSRVIE